MPKKEKVREMFDSIAPSYDKLNHVLSMNVDKLWRRHALKEIVDGTAQRILDVACGTGDSTISIAKAADANNPILGMVVFMASLLLWRSRANARQHVKKNTSIPCGIVVFLLGVGRFGAKWPTTAPSARLSALATGHWRLATSLRATCRRSGVRGTP